MEGNAIKTEVAERLCQDITYSIIPIIISTIEGIFTNKSRVRNNTLHQAVYKIKLQRKRHIGEYIDQHRLLRDYMLEAETLDAVLEDLTIGATVDETNKNGARNAFRASLSMSIEDAYPQSVKALEDMMTAYEKELPDNHWDKQDWKFPTKHQHKQGHGQRKNKYKNHKKAVEKRKLRQ